MRLTFVPHRYPGLSPDLLGKNCWRGSRMRGKCLPTAGEIFIRKSFRIGSMTWRVFCKVIMPPACGHGRSRSVAIIGVSGNRGWIGGSSRNFSRACCRWWRRFPRGLTLTYGQQVAASIGKPSASRAVGGAVGSNPWPVLVPCHRVMGSTGKLTGFSAPGGVSAKQRMLDLERH